MVAACQGNSLRVKSISMKQLKVSKSLFFVKFGNLFCPGTSRDRGTISKSCHGTGQAGTASQNLGRDKEMFFVLSLGKPNAKGIGVAQLIWP